MLLSFTIENWMSFRDKQEFSMLASKEKNYGSRLSKPLSYMPRVLPVAALYGANASGKSNFFKALLFIQALILRGVRPSEQIPTEAFKLSVHNEDKPSAFTFLLLINKNVYEYGISMTRQEITHEQLTLIQSKTEKILFYREQDNITFPDLLPHSNIERLKLVAESTRAQQPFLTNSIELNLKEFEPVYSWFKDKLMLISPQSSFLKIAEIAGGKHQYSEQFNQLLASLDTQIARLDLQDIAAEQIHLPKPILEDLGRHTGQEGMTVINAPNDTKVFMQRSSAGTQFKKLVAIHQRDDGQEIPFELKLESDGTKRIIDLLPALMFLCASDSESVIVIDELDQSLHHMLTRYFIEYYLSHRAPTATSQLIFSTHDVLLFDQDIFRRDELWLTEKATDGASRLFSVSEFKDARYDKIIRKSYLEGRMGAIPNLY